MVKSLEEIKAEQEQRKWKWKERKMEDLHEIMRSREQEVPTTILERQKKLQEAERDLKEKEVNHQERH